MKRLATAMAAIALTVTPAFAADMAVKAPPPALAPVPISTWTGPYIGGDIGAAWASDPSFSFADLGNAAYNTCSFCGGPYSSPTLSGNRHTELFGGIFAGYNWQFSRLWVAGIEADSSWTNLSASASGQLFDNGSTVVSGSNLSFHTDVKWLASVRGRLGWLIAPNWLIYGTGGVAWGRFANSANATCNVPGSDCFYTTFLTGAPFSNVSTETGWVAGGGVEWQIVDHVRARVEYLYYRFNETMNGTAAFTGPTPPICIGPGPCLAAYTFGGNMNIQTVRGGISYAF